MIRETTNSASATATAANDDGETCYLLRNVEGRTLMLELRLRNGDHRALPYAYLLEVSYERSTGIRLRFTGAAVQIRGRNLARLYEGFLTQRVQWVQEGTAGRDFAPEGAPFISDVIVRGGSSID